MQPQQNPTQTNQPPQTNTQAQPSQQVQTAHPPFYRQYWPFGIIFIFAPLGLIFGIVVLLTGTVYKKQKDTSAYVSISKREKFTILIAAVLLQGFYIMSAAG